LRRSFPACPLTR